MIEDKIKELGYELPETPKPLAAYVPAVLVKDIVYTAGQGTLVKGEIKYTGIVGKDLTEEEGKKAAEICALNCLAAVKSVIGSLDKIEQIVKLTVFVNSADNFYNQPEVANGASELLGKIFGEKGAHARSAVGVNALPRNIAVEVEMIVKLKQ
jgi:enamine deaminase RidA (YjgF/YER057c/UK114 family)